MTVHAHPIIFTAESVRAILAGRKTQTRRVVRQDHADRLGLALVGIAERMFPHERAEPIHIEPGVCPWVLGQRLWVRETWRCDAVPPPAHTADEGEPHVRWRSPIYMPRWASRLTLAVTDVSVERLRAITEGDAVAEGVTPGDGAWHTGPGGAYQADPHGWYVGHVRHNAPTHAYRAAWDRINGKRPGCRWDSNPWVWKISFEVER